MNMNVSRELNRPEVRAEYERARRTLKSELCPLPLDAAAARVAQLAATLDQAVARIKGELLASSLCWNETHQALVAWLSDEHEHLFDMAHAVVAASAASAGKSDDEMTLLRLPAAALYHWGE